MIKSNMSLALDDAGGAWFLVHEHEGRILYARKPTSSGWYIHGAITAEGQKRDAQTYFNDQPFATRALADQALGLWLAAFDVNLPPARFYATSQYHVRNEPYVICQLDPVGWQVRRYQHLASDQVTQEFGGVFGHAVFSTRKQALAELEAWLKYQGLLDQVSAGVATP